MKCTNDINHQGKVLSKLIRENIWLVRFTIIFYVTNNDIIQYYIDLIRGNYFPLTWLDTEIKIRYSLDKILDIYLNIYF